MYDVSGGSDLVAEWIVLFEHAPRITKNLIFSGSTDLGRRFGICPTSMSLSQSYLRC